MLFAILQPAALGGLLLAFLSGVGVRATAQAWLARRVLHQRGALSVPQLRRDVDPFGAVAAVLAGTGWGRPAVLPEPGCQAYPPGGRALVSVGGPAAVIGLGMATLAGHRLIYPDSVLLSALYPSDILRGASGPLVEQVLISLSVGLLCFGVLAFVPLPPLDGWELLWLVLRRPGATGQKVRFWLVERNLGILLLLVLLVFPLGGGAPVLLTVLDMVINPLIRLLTA